ADARRALGLPATGRVIAVSGGGWGVGDLAGATRAALEFEDAIVLCLCGRNDRTRSKVVAEFGSEPRLRVMGFTDRMGDVLAAADVLVHSSAGLTILEAIIRGCPIVSYGFSYGHVQVTDAALERFKLAEVAHEPSDLQPAIARALDRPRPEPDMRFARRPSTASLILSDDRRSVPIPTWRLRTVRAATSMAAVVAIAAWTLTTGASYSLVSHIVHIKPVTAVATDRPQVGVLIDAPAGAIPALAAQLSQDRIHASFAVAKPSTTVVTSVIVNHDQALPRLSGGGLFRWLGARGQLYRMLHWMGHRRHFLYASAGPSLGQWLVAHGAGGSLVAGAVKLQDADDPLGALHAGEVIQFDIGSPSGLQPLVAKLLAALQEEHLSAVPVGQLMHQADATD
ncbi:MAG: glycosyltransferase, partial [Solirubrobacteraceae bacterium]